MATTEVAVSKLVKEDLSFVFVEAIHVELPHEGRVVGVFEVTRKQFFAEAINLPDDEAVSIAIPMDQRLTIGGLFVMATFDHVPDLLNECGIEWQLHTTHRIGNDSKENS